MTPTNPTLEGIFTQMTGNEPSPISPNAPLLDRLCGMLLGHSVSATMAIQILLTEGDKKPDELYTRVIERNREIYRHDEPVGGMDEVRVAVNEIGEAGVTQVGQEGYLSLSTPGEQLAKAFWFPLDETSYHPKYQSPSE